MNDTCPNCLRRDNPPIRDTVGTAFGSESAGESHRYHCRGCGHRWATSWGPTTSDVNDRSGYDPPDDPPDDPEDQPGYWDQVDCGWDPRDGW